jgi:hypothetical protein
MKFPFLIVVILLFFSCKKTVCKEPQSYVSACMQTMIDSALAKPKGYVIYKIDAYEYNGASVYLYYTGCCDRYNELKDANCNLLFYPSGGFSGGGDGTHPNFFKDVKFIMTVWVDPRL